MGRMNDFTIDLPAIIRALFERPRQIPALAYVIPAWAFIITILMYGSRRRAESWAKGLGLLGIMVGIVLAVILKFQPMWFVGNLNVFVLPFIAGLCGFFVGTILGWLSTYVVSERERPRPGIALDKAAAQVRSAKSSAALEVWIWSLLFAPFGVLGYAFFFGGMAGKDNKTTDPPLKQEQKDIGKMKAPRKGE